MQVENVAVIGAGNGGHAIAADLTLAGYRVNMFEFEFFKGNVEPMLKRGGIEISGGSRTGFAKIERVTTSIGKALDGVQLIIVAVPAFAHKHVAEEIAPHLRPEQTIVLNPGHTGGSLEFHRTLRSSGIKGRTRLGETMSLTYGCRLIAPAHVHVGIVTKKLLFSAFPSRDTPELIEIFKQLYPNVVPAKDVLETGLTNVNAVLHPPGMIMNAGWIEFTNGNFNYYSEGITPAVAAAIDAVDKERLSIMKTLGYREVPFVQLYYDLGYAPKLCESIYDSVHLAGGEKSFKAPENMQHRYLTEDVPYGLVPMASIAAVVGVRTPRIDSMIDLSSIAVGRNLRQEGLTVEKLGLANMTPDQMHTYVREGLRGGQEPMRFQHKHD